MALIDARWRSPALNLAVSFGLIMPAPAAPGETFPVLWLFSASGGKYTEWIRYTDAERLAEKKKIAIVATEAQHSDYADMAHGFRWFTYVSRELPRLLSMNFPLKCGGGAPEYAYGAGMGGLAAIRMGLRFPDRFRACGAIDADIALFERQSDAAHRKRIETIYAAPLSRKIRDENDVLRLLGWARGGAKKPRLYVAANAGSELTSCAETFCKKANAAGYACDFNHYSGKDPWEARALDLAAFIDAVSARDE